MSIPEAVSRRELVIIGAGGFGAVAASIAESMNAASARHNGAAPWEVIGFADGDAAKRGTRHAGHAVLGTVEEVGRNFHGRVLWFFCAIGDNRARAEMAWRAQEFGWKPASLVHPSAILDSTVEIGAGSYIGPAVVISYNSKVGAHVVVDAHASVGHDAVLMDFCEVFSGARVNGNCQVGESALIGCNATLLPGTLVGDRAVVGANSLAGGLVEPDTTIFGVPARIIRRARNPFSARQRVRVAKEGQYGQHDAGEDN
jgi:sugar O-acyltransferase (sialic acid O-acetyltransferase NeuD family)